MYVLFYTWPSGRQQTQVFWYATTVDMVVNSPLHHDTWVLVKTIKN